MRLEFCSLLWVTLIISYIYIATTAASSICKLHSNSSSSAVRLIGVGREWSDFFLLLFCKDQLTKRLVRAMVHNNNGSIKNNLDGVVLWQINTRGVLLYSSSTDNVLDVWVEYSSTAVQPKVWQQIQKVDYFKFECSKVNHNKWEQINR